LRLPHVVSIDFWQYKVEVEVLVVGRCRDIAYISVSVMGNAYVVSVLRSVRARNF